MKHQPHKMPLPKMPDHAEVTRRQERRPGKRPTRQQVRAAVKAYQVASDEK